MKIKSFDGGRVDPALYVAASVERYYDRRIRSWTIIKRDKYGNQCGDAYYTGVKSGAISVQKSYQKEIDDANNSL